MERNELNRMFDQLSLTPEQEQEGLRRLLQTERKVTTMKKLKKLTVLGIAAALMVVTCAAAVVMGLDQRLAEYFGAEPEQLASAVATQDPMSHTYDSGWTVQISQVLSDRYMAAALIDFAAPEGMALPIPEGTTAEQELTLMVDYRIEDRDGNLIGSLKDAPLPSPIAYDSEDGRPVYDHWDREVAGDGLGNCEYLENSDPKQGRISVLWKYVLGTSFEDFAEDRLLGAQVSIIPKGMIFDSTRETIYFAEDALWSYDLTLPETDSGNIYTMEAPLMIGEYEVKLETIYLSPLELAYEFAAFAPMPANGLMPLYEEEARNYSINMADGSAVSMKRAFSHHSKLVGDRGIDHIGLYPVEFVDPAQVVSFSMFGQTFELK